MNITMDQIDEFALKGAIRKLESILRDIEFLAQEREAYGIRAMADDAVTEIKAVKYVLKISEAMY